MEQTCFLDGLLFVRIKTGVQIQCIEFTTCF